jgi:divalent metal cation (Fe/Co/Zn/Cd) transporter
MNFIGIIGIFVFLVGLISIYYEIPDLVDIIILKISEIATLVAVIFTAISIYMKENQRGAEIKSKILIAPAIIVTCVIVLLACVHSGIFKIIFSFFGTPIVSRMPSNVINGLSLLGLAGTLLRLLSR